MSSFTCSNCGAAIKPSQTICTECNSEILWEAPVARVRRVRRPPKLGIPRGPRSGTLARVSLGILALLGIFLLATVWGLERGLQERRAIMTGLDPQRYVQGLYLLASGQVEAARGEFQQVVAVELRKTPTPTVTPTPTFGPTPTPVPPTPTPRFNELSLQEAIRLAQAAMDSKDWQDAITRLQALRELDPGYQAGLVGQMLFNAYFNQALAFQASGDIDAAAEALNAALVLRPGNTAANAMRQELELYRRGAAALGVDWDAAISAFTELFALAPAAQNVQTLLFEAYVGSGDSHLRAEPCLAQERYQLALQIENDPQVRAKLGDARLRCSSTPTPDAAAPTDVTPTPTPGPIPGRIAYTFFDDDRTFHSTAIWDVKSARTLRVIAAESVQPDLGPDGAIVARSTQADTFGLVLLAGSQAAPERLTQEAGDVLPRLSPDGGSVLFTSSTRSGDGKSHLYLLDRATRRVRDLGEGRGGAWSPTGEQIVYQGCGGSDGKDCGLWVLNPATANRTQLTTVGSDSMPAWSPDGRFITFMSEGRSPSWDVFVADARTGNIPLFALADALDGLPVWSPDGKSIAFLSNREGEWAVYTWLLDDLTVVRLFAVPGSLPAWQEAGLDWGP